MAALVVEILASIIAVVSNGLDFANKMGCELLLGERS